MSLVARGDDANGYHSPTSTSSFGAGRAEGLVAVERRLIHSKAARTVMPLGEPHVRNAELGAAGIFAEVGR
jgi:hypothetical protein